MKISRRDLARGLAATGAAAAASSLTYAQPPVGEKKSHAAWTQVFPGVWRARIGEPERITPVTVRAVPPLESAFAHLPAVAMPPISAIEAQQTERGCLLQLPLQPEEEIYGLGLQLLSFAQRGKKKTVRVNADPRGDTGDTHAPVPFFVTTNGIGIFVDTARYATFYFGDVRHKPSQPEASTARASLDPNYTQSDTATEQAAITIEVPRAKGVDVYLFAGPTTLDAVRRYNIFSGGGVVPPEWGLGFWYRADAHSTTKSALALAQEFRDRNIPCDVLGLEPGWQTHAYSCTFVWEPSRFSDPKAFVDAATQLDYKVNLWEHAFTHPASPVFAPLEPHAGDYGVWGGLVPDLVGAPARTVFGDYHGNALIDLGISGFKLDECDNSDYTGGWSFPEHSRFPSGVDGEQMHNLFGLGYQRAIWDQFLKRRQPTYNLVRSSGALAAPYPFVLYSDLYQHRDFIRALVNSGFSGLLWCPEVRDASSEEDLIRRLQSVIFSPLAMVNGWYIQSPPWKQLDRKKNNAGELLPDWEALEARCREIIGWRMSLVPYLKAAFARYAEDGTPPFRALALEDAGDNSLRDVDDEYWMGDRIIVAPLFAGEAERKIVLPEGKWHDFWTGEIVSSREFTVPHTREHIPVYIASGSVMPWAAVGPHTGAPERNKLIVRVYGDGAKSFEWHAGINHLMLKWSDGSGLIEQSGSAYSKSDYSVTEWKHFE
ncbi:TIM-barrel domain-containing protein [Acidicapsa dinghuensis]|uniref:TIM-barrel domain-containing protein n=1 Tax=Acidicapsa dinghuensis TaxID=2218256 RepID=A0ABW1EAE6_9BACT|nr:TIM-barrel domain-containing protein [Acidicapsa dinghuensis]